MRYQELNLDGLVGPSHNYAGLSPGNLASANHRGQVASPRDAALQGLEKMWYLHQRGLEQAVMPPRLRPRFDLLHALGFSGSDADMLQQAAKQAPELLAACYSASGMWAANSATVSCSADTADGRVHFTPANLLFNLHRSLEAEESGYFLQRIFTAGQHFSHHPPLPASTSLGDEGAANHTRLCASHERAGISLLTFGYQPGGQTPLPRRFPARQSRQACEAIIRAHQLKPDYSLCLQQLPASIDRGVFHNDVIAVGHRNLLLMHEDAWHDQQAQLQNLQRIWQQQSPDIPLFIEQIRITELSVHDAVRSYLFNSQLLSLPDNSLLLLAPQECRENGTEGVIDRLLADSNPLSDVVYMDLRQSMHNGGGPACLRLRVPLSDTELGAMHQGVRMNEALYRALREWISKHYRDRLSSDDLRDYQLALEIRQALEELEQILQLPGLYSHRY